MFKCKKDFQTHRRCLELHKREYLLCSTRGVEIKEEISYDPITGLSTYVNFITGAQHQMRGPHECSCNVVNLDNWKLTIPSLMYFFINSNDIEVAVNVWLALPRSCKTLKEAIKWVEKVGESLPRDKIKKKSCLWYDVNSKSLTLTNSGVKLNQDTWAWS